MKKNYLDYFDDATLKEMCEKHAASPNDRLQEVGSNVQRSEAGTTVEVSVRLLGNSYSRKYTQFGIEGQETGGHSFSWIQTVASHLPDKMTTIEYLDAAQSAVLDKMIEQREERCNQIKADYDKEILKLEQTKAAAVSIEYKLYRKNVEGVFDSFSKIRTNAHKKEEMGD